MIFLAAILGLVVGSFLNVVINRLAKKQTITAGRSMCPHCRHVLAPIDLVPIFSFIWLRGRCRYCRKPISWQYPLVELTTAIVFMLLAVNLQFTISNLEFLFAIIFVSLLIVIGIYDYKHYLILDKLVYPGLALAVVYRLLTPHLLLLDGVYGTAVIAGFFALQYFVSRGRWLGWGDVKLGLFLGMLFGFKLGLTMLFVAYVLGAFVGICLLASGRKHLSSKLPFGSFLAISGIIILLYGAELVNWYFNLIGLS
jgi:leader peptidase (prepilin peptidase)/N-methyltransferase